MSTSLNAFLPLLLRRILSEKRDHPIEGDIFQLHGACIFADVSGFTVLSEKLAQMGKEGSEELTRILNEFYDCMVDEIMSWNGDIIKFAGDAITVYYPEPGGLDRALCCSLKMQENMHRFSNRTSPVGNFSLKMKIGVSCGDCIGSVVGDTRDADFLFAGSIVDESAEAEHHAKAGDVVLFNGQTFDIVHDYKEPHTYSPAEQINISEKKLYRFLPHDLIETLSFEGRSFANEHRRTVIMFISFERDDQSTSYKNISWLQDFYQLCLSITREYDGYINKIDMGDKGAKIIILFGAPVTHEDDPDRAVMAALKIKEMAMKQGIITKIGINYASIFAGIVGSQKRCEYTVMGDGVNLAARLMSAASPNSILCHTVVRENTRLTYLWQDLPPIKVKGKADAQTIVELREQAESGFDSTQFFQFSNRKKEVALITEFIKDSDQKGISLVSITGSQGIGKSALVLYSLANVNISNIYLGTAHDYTKNTPYFPWKRIVKEMLEKQFAGNSNILVTINHILKKTSPQLLPFASLLGNLIGEATLSDDVEALDLETRKNILWKIIQITIEEASRRDSLIIIIDNYQCLDEPSQSLIQELLLSLTDPAPIFFILGRTECNVEVPDIHRLDIELSPFGSAEAEQFALDFLKIRDIPPKVLTRLMKMSKGIPLVLQEVLRSFVDTGYIERSSEYSDLLLVNDLALTSIPETLDGMVMSRFDRLKPFYRSFIRMISVFGEEMPRELVGAVSGKSGIGFNDPDHIAELRDFINDNTESGMVHFVQPYFRAVIYESIDYATRRTLHRELGEICRKSLHSDYIYRDEILAYHYSLGEDAESAIPYLSKVVNKSVSNHSYSTAVEQYERLIRFISSVFGEQKTGEYKLEFVEILIKLGEFEKCESILTDMMDTVISDEDLFSRVTFSLGQVFDEQGKFEDAIVMYKLCQQRSTDEFLKFKCARGISTVFAKQGNLDKAYQHFRDLIKTYDEFSDSTEYGIALLNLGLTRFHLGKTDIKLFEEALKIFRARKDIFNEMKVLNSLGQVFLQQGSYNKSLARFHQTYQLASQFGYNSMLSLSLGNLGFINSIVLNYLKAQSFCEKSTMYAKKFNNKTMSQMITLINLAEIKAKLADFETANTLYQNGLALSRELGFHIDFCLFEYSMFLYKVDCRKALTDILVDMTTMQNDDSPLKMKLATNFFNATLATNVSDKKSHLETVLQNALENNIHQISFYSLVELFNMHIADQGLLKKDLDTMKKLLTKKMSIYNIIYYLSYLRFQGSDSLVRKLDSLFRKYPWPEYSWKRHFWIGIYYQNQGKYKTAKKRFKRANNEMQAILDQINNEELRSAIIRKSPYPELVDALTSVEAS